MQCPLFSSPYTSPLPTLCFLNEPGAEWVALDIANKLHEMIVLFTQKGLVATLVQVAVTYGLVCRMPTLGMCQCEPVHELGEIPVLSCMHHQMPVVGHDAICK